MYKFSDINIDYENDIVGQEGPVVDPPFAAHPSARSTGLDIQIKGFSGPLDLLLQLIQREKMDIFDINIHKITEQYLDFIDEYPHPDLDSAGGFYQNGGLTYLYQVQKPIPF